jgi:hypothetical protein
LQRRCPGVAAKLDSVRFLRIVWRGAPSQR